MNLVLPLPLRPFSPPTNAISFGLVGEYAANPGHFYCSLHFTNDSLVYEYTQFFPPFFSVILMSDQIK